MAAEDVKKLLGKLMSDPAFKANFEADRDGALRGYNLTPAEKDALKEFDVKQIDKFELGLTSKLDTQAKKIGLYLG